MRAIASPISGAIDMTRMLWATLTASVGNIVGVIVSARATLAGVMNGAGWLFVLTYGLLLLGYAYSLWALSRKHAGQAAQP